MPRGGDGEHARQRVGQPAGDAGGHVRRRRHRSRLAAAPSGPAPVRPPAATWAASRRTGTAAPTNCSSCHGYPPSSRHQPPRRQPDRVREQRHHVPGGAQPVFDLPRHLRQLRRTRRRRPDSARRWTRRRPGDSTSSATMHGDGSVQINGVGGANAPYTENTGYNATTWACDNAGCHTNTVKFLASTQLDPGRVAGVRSGSLRDLPRRVGGPGPERHDLLVGFGGRPGRRSRRRRRRRGAAVHRLSRPQPARLAGLGAARHRNVQLDLGQRRHAQHEHVAPQGGVLHGIPGQRRPATGASRSPWTTTATGSATT